ncbi:hypothetical protein CLTEP_16510 [Clostridium tepidiprofundi DSM 19306]|uniref:Glycoside hydrolase 123 catalytic domain-containing protein n=1 Tax=Clostridium tepidiprofundi DSM 19306 TaxID=1121338 RepID=A0A151B3C5_9CLOT|nr:DUF4091 domain-containing protein [Clostridium tepidiprofundi]KYH34418.1 hypothetical protein CLTEP_16510 [Clostridium tepidiprofundi DSM 19306]
MNVKYCLLNSDYKHIKYKEVSENLWKRKSLQITAAKEQKFAFQIMINCDTEVFCSLDKNNNISYKGLENKLRLNLKVDESLQQYFNISFLGYVKDDCGLIVSDPILNEPAIMLEKDISQMLWVEGIIPSSYDKDSIDIVIDVYSQYGYEDEKKETTIKVKLNIVNICLKSLKDYDFHLDLWQHPSNWARMYKTPLWSYKHFEIIENYIKELAQIGEKVITLIVSDFLWAGQSCYKIHKNASNLFEHNMVKIIKNKEGNIECNFDNLDKYIEICMKHGIDKEIAIFGILGNWAARDFGNPIKDYKDPIRLNYYDEKSDTFKYITSKCDLKRYLKLLFNHLEDKKLLDKVYIISDEPNNTEVYWECIDFINSASNNKKLKYKTALHDENFTNNCMHMVDQISLSLPLAISNMDKLKDEKNKSKTATWYVCCFPDKLNNFINSPLIESRLIGWFTYLFELDGFLRWDYAIWPNNPWENISYKYPAWKAGDMFFVYPGKDLNPVRSIRFENLRFGIQDHQLLKLLESKGLSKNIIEKKFLEKLLGKKAEMKAPDDRSVELNYSLDYNLYCDALTEIMKML